MTAEKISFFANLRGTTLVRHSAVLTVTSALMLAPLGMIFPAPADAHEVAVSEAREATADLAVTEKTLEEVAVPGDYLDPTPSTVEEVRQAEENIVAVGEETPVVGAQGMSLARALISSPTVVFGVSMPQGVGDGSLNFSYRSRTADTWTSWQPLEIAEVEQAPVAPTQAVFGTEPLFLVGVEEIEVSVTTPEGLSVSGAQLTVIEPELTPAQLPEAQRTMHGEQALQAEESLTDDLRLNQNELTQPSPAESELPVREEGTQTDNDAEAASLGKEDNDLTPAELAEEEANVQLPVPGSGQTALGGSLTIRAQGMSNDGRSYVTNLPGLTINTRKAWGANESLMDWDPEPANFKGAVVHHTAGSNDYTKTQVPGVIQGVYRYHAVTLGWGDIGYHLVVDKFGGVWEGRAGGLTRMVEGGHAYGANTTTFGVSVLGDYMKVKPSNEAIDAVAKAVAWKLKVHDITNMNATFTTKGKQYGKSSITLPVVSAHRHVGGTTCPGDAFMTRWDELQGKVRSYMKQLTSASDSPSAPLTVARWDERQQIGQGWPKNMYYAAEFLGIEHTDAMYIDAQGDLWLYPSTNYGKTFSARKRIGYGWGVMDRILTGSDFDGDSVTDIVARHKNGELYLYPGNGKGGFKSKKKIGWGWSIFTELYMMQRLDNGRPVIYGVTEQGQLRAYPTDGKGAFRAPISMGYGWNKMRALNNVGDMVGGSASDVIAIDEQGKMWLYEGRGAGALGGRRQIGQGWGVFTPVHTLDASGRMWAVDGTGKLWLYVLHGI